MAYSEKMPVLFLGHGNPMNAIVENEFVSGFRNLGHELPKPESILCISAHWETKGTHVTATPSPQTMHDFGGFPPELYDVRYPAPGSPELAMKTKNSVTRADVGLDYKWGLDHGAWSVIKHLYPDAGIPVVQMSLDYTKAPDYHYEMAKELQQLRHNGVLIIGSGNMVHNLSLVDWRRLDDMFAYDWAMEASETMKKLILEGSHLSLVNIRKMGRAFEMAIPTPEHYLPLLYALAIREEDDKITLFNDKPVGGSLYMTSVRIEAG
jgi:4,5-DOPA dioxygenase extradiol